VSRAEALRGIAAISAPIQNRRGDVTIVGVTPTNGPRPMPTQAIADPRISA
jgi:hypothetical protein